MGILNYATNFIKGLTKIISLTKIIRPLQLMLKKNAPPWTPSQTDAIQKIKEKIPFLPPLQIPLDGTHILQTDANENF